MHGITSFIRLSMMHASNIWLLAQINHNSTRASEMLSCNAGDRTGGRLQHSYYATVMLSHTTVVQYSETSLSRLMWYMPVLGIVASHLDFILTNPHKHSFPATTDSHCFRSATVTSLNQYSLLHALEM